MKILLSIKPEYAEKIFSGEKRFEFRKAIFRNRAVKVVVVYATQPVGKVVGEFEIEAVLEAHPRVIWSKTKRFSGITRSFFDEYFSGRDRAYAIKVSKAERYTLPLDLNSVVPSCHAPQFFRYLPADNTIRLT